MNKTPDWQRPVELSPEDLTPETRTSPEPQTTSAREIPLELTQATPEPEHDEQPLPPRASSGHRSRLWLWGTILALILLTIGAELYRLISWGSDLHPLLGLGLGLLTLILTGALAFELRLGFKGHSQLRQVHRLQAQAQSLADQNTHGNSTALIQQLERLYRQTGLQPEMQQAVQQLDSSYNDREIIQYLNRHALCKADHLAQRCVQRYSIESGVLVAFSPWASFDMLLVAWRNLRMLREIATIYGVTPGWLTQGRLLKQVLQNLAFAGASEMAMEAGSALLSSSLTAGLSARAGQGLGAGLFTARTGMTAMKLCRPLPDGQQDTGMLSKIAKGIVQRLTSRA